MTIQPEATDVTPAPIVSMSGELVSLGPIEPTMAPLLVDWENDALVAHLSGDPVRPTTAEAMRQAHERREVDAAATMVRFAVYERPSMRVIGIVDLRGIDHAHQTAVFGITIGERDAWGKGYGTEATRLTMEYAFDVLDLNAVVLEVYSFNGRGLGAYRRAGFREVGRRRAAHRAAGGSFDVVVMECIADEFRAAASLGAAAPRAFFLR